MKQHEIRTKGPTFIGGQRIDGGVLVATILTDAPLDELSSAIGAQILAVSAPADNDPADNDPADNDPADNDPDDNKLTGDTPIDGIGLAAKVSGILHDAKLTTVAAARKYLATNSTFSGLTGIGEPTSKTIAKLIAE